MARHFPPHQLLPPAEGEAAANAQRRLYFHHQRQWLLGLGLALALVAEAADPASRVWGLAALLGAWLAYSFLFIAIARRWPEGPGKTRALALYFAGEVALLAAGLRFFTAPGLGAILFIFVVLYAPLALPRQFGLAVTALAAAGWAWAAASHLGGGQQRIEWLAAGIAGIFVCGHFAGEFARVLTGVSRALSAANQDLRLAAKELRQHRNNLEGLVAQRTGELAAAGDELRRANAELRRLNTAKSQFLANVSHELRTPLTSIRSFSELLLAYPEEALETRTEFLQIIKSETLRLTRLINDVLDWSKIEAGQMSWRDEPADLAEAAQTAAAAMRAWAEAKGLRLRLVREAEPGTAILRGDFDRLVQVAANLLSNAIKFTARGEVEIGVRPESAAAGAAADTPRQWCLYVRDNGPGISSDDLPRIFESFQQGGDPLTNKPQGTGLGLAICREIVQHHEGRIWAENQPGGGCTFYCLFPAAAPGGLPLTAASVGGADRG